MAGRKKADDVNYEEDLDQIDFNNYKGMFFGDDPGQKYQDKVTGAHFEYHDMCKRLRRLQHELLPQPSSPDDIGTDSTKEIPDGEEAKSHKTVKESGQALLLQGLMPAAQPKESRNGVQALPQQGYGTVGACYNNAREPPRAVATEAKNFRQFSSQLDSQSKPRAAIKTAVQAPNRSKSIDRPRPFVSRATNGSAMHTSGMKLRVSSTQKNAHASDSRRETFYALYACLTQYWR